MLQHWGWVLLTLLLGCRGAHTLAQSPPCCSSILLDSHLEDHKVIGDRLGFYQQLGQHNARPAYRSTQRIRLHCTFGALLY